MHLTRQTQGFVIWSRALATFKYAINKLSPRTLNISRVIRHHPLVLGTQALPADGHFVARF